MALPPRRGNGGLVGTKCKADVERVIIYHDHPLASPRHRLPHILPLLTWHVGHHHVKPRVRGWPWRGRVGGGEAALQVGL